MTSYVQPLRSTGWGHRGRYATAAAAARTTTVPNS
jgi:hypothetical protein